MSHEPLRLDFEFTQKDTPELRSRIRRDLDTVWRRVQEEDPLARALVLTGGFSRGEGGARGARPLNDYDLVVVREKPWPSAADAYARLEDELSADLGLHVDVGAVSRQRLRFLAPKVFWFDTRHGGRVIAGDPRVLDRVPDWPPERIPPAEAARLLANRATGLLVAVPDAGERGDEELALRQAAKAFLACAEAELVLAGTYHPRARERLERLERLAKARTELSQLARGVAWATAYKLDPDGPQSRVDPAERWSAARDALLSAADRVLPKAGWGPFRLYPERAPHDVADVVVAASRARRLPPLKPSHRVRALGFRLLEGAQWPAGAVLAPPSAGEAARAFRVPPPLDWREARSVLFALRARTLH